MFEIEKTFTAPKIDPYPSLGDPGKVLFFDIETTGLSPYGSALYLLGAAYEQEGIWHLRQWFSASLSDEIPILQAFSEFLQNFGTVVHYNGDTFDIPYLKALYEQYHLASPFDRIISVDLLKAARRTRPLLNPDSLRQKHVEKALGIDREDPYTGAELIEVYKYWQAHPSDRLLHDLLLHNEEDVKCMIPIVSILSFDELLVGNCRPVSFSSEEDAAADELRLCAEYPYHFPVARYIESDCGIQAQFRDNRITIRVSVLHAELRKYLPNPKQYYYLPKEDMVIPKELGSGVDPRNRVPARKETCYVRLEGDFLPALAGLPCDHFRKDLLDKSLWVRKKDVSPEEYFQAFLTNLLTFRQSHDID